MFREHWLVPLLGIAVLTVAGATRFDESRELLGTLAVLGVPIAAMVVAAAPLRETNDVLRGSGFAIAALVALGAELLLAPTALPSSPLVARFAPLAHLPAVWLGLGAAALATVPVEVAAAKRGVGSRFAALAGITVAFAIYLPGRLKLSDGFGSTMVALLVALFLGGGLGLAVGTLARKAAGARI